MNIFSEKIHRFFHSPIAGGAVLILCTVVALVLSNVDATAGAYHAIWSADFSIGFDGFGLTKPFELWINDALMAVFFFAVGLEIKREIVAGELRSLRQASLPIAAAIGGMVVPALIYLTFNGGTATEDGWGIPMATDIAFALGILSLMSRRVPLSLKIFLTALAIVDDLGAILVIAVFYSSQIDWAALIGAGLLFALLLTLAKMRVYKMRWYLIPAVILWILFLKSGVHATIAGVLIATAMPATSKFSKEHFWGAAPKIVDKFKQDDINHVQVLSNENQRESLQRMRVLARNTMSPVQRLEHSLHSTVAFLIMPIFALCNAGVVISADAIPSLMGTQPVGIVAGLVLGKPIGILLFSFLAVRLGWASMPSGATWRTLTGVACLGGIGFTMSIFIDNLAFSDPSMVATGKIAILTASILAAIIGSAIISTSPKTH